MRYIHEMKKDRESMPMTTKVGQRFDENFIQISEAMCSL